MFVFHNRTVPSWLPVASRGALGLKATALTWSEALPCGTRST